LYRVWFAIAKAAPQVPIKNNPPKHVHRLTDGRNSSLLTKGRYSAFDLPSISGAQKTTIIPTEGP